MPSLLNQRMHARDPVNTSQDALQQIPLRNERGFLGQKATIFLLQYCLLFSKSRCWCLDFFVAGVTSGLPLIAHVHLSIWMCRHETKNAHTNKVDRSIRPEEEGLPIILSPQNSLQNKVPEMMTMMMHQVEYERTICLPYREERLDPISSRTRWWSSGWPFADSWCCFAE
jgi:hypothetical protein